MDAIENSIKDEKIKYKKNKKRYLIILSIGIFLCLSIFALSLCMGNYKTSLKDVIQALITRDESNNVYKIIKLIRMPRLLAAIVVGVALSISGLVYQDIFNNRMASPDILGVSSGAGVGASIAIFLGLPFIFTSALAFFSGLIAVLLSMLISCLFSKSTHNNVALILAGIIVGGLMSSFLGLFKYLSNDSQLSSITFWLLGGFYNVTYLQLSYAIPIIVIGTVLLFIFRWKIIMLGNGEKDASVHGINTKSLKIIVILTTTIITSVAICISGTIGWIGLAIPNLIRLMMKNDSKYMMPVTIVYGIMFTSLCDLFARTLTNTEIPVGIITGILGTVIFITILLVQGVENKWIKR